MTYILLIGYDDHFILLTVISGRPLMLTAILNVHMSNSGFGESYFSLLACIYLFTDTYKAHSP